MELLTVLVVGPLACFVCYDIAKGNPRSNIIMTIIATAEIYGGMCVCYVNLLTPMLLPDTDFMAVRLHDFLPRVAHWKPVPGHQQLDVQVGVPCVLQHPLGLDSSLRSLRSVPPICLAFPGLSRPSRPTYGINSYTCLVSWALTPEGIELDK